MSIESLDGTLLTRKSKPIDTRFFLSELYPNIQEQWESMLPDDDPVFLEMLSGLTTTLNKYPKYHLKVAIDKKNDIRYFFKKRKIRKKQDYHYFLISKESESGWRKSWREGLKKEAQTRYDNFLEEYC